MIRLVSIGGSGDAYLGRLRELLDYDPAIGVFRWRKHADVNPRYWGRRAGTASGNGYRQIQIDFIRYFEHRLAWLYVTGEWPDQQVDHRNRIRDDNRFPNLRKATSSQNHFNTTKQKNNTSGVKGVSFDTRRKKWRACICKNRKQQLLGYFSTKIEAADAYALAAAKLHGNFARLS